jgi:hypothetical protein
VRRQTRTGFQPAGEYEGLEVFRPGAAGTGIYMVGTTDDAFVLGRCNDRSHPEYLCSFQFRVTDGIWGTVSFTDIRTAGGRAEANRRVRFSRDVACRFLARC